MKKDDAKAGSGVKSALVRRRPPESTVAERVARAARTQQQGEEKREDDGERLGNDGESPASALKEA
jgi:hypothetical protein